MLKYSKKALVNTGQGAKRADPRVYTPPQEEHGAGRTKMREGRSVLRGDCQFAMMTLIVMIKMTSSS